MQLKQWRVRGLAVIAMSLVVALTVAACGGGDDSESTASDQTSETTGGEQAAESHTVGLVIPSLTTPYWSAVKDGAEASAAATPGLELQVGGASSGTGVDETQVMLNSINDMLTKGVEALVIADGFEQFTPTLERALSDGVPVVFVDANISGLTEEEVTVVATEPVAAGTLAGEFIVEQLGGKGQIGLLQGLSGFKVSLDRTESAKSTVEESSDIKVVGNLPTECDRVKALNATKDMMTANPDIELIYTACGPPTSGALQALKQIGRTDVKVIGFDAEEELLEAIESGALLATVAQFPKKQGEIGVLKALEALETGTVPPSVDAGTEIVTKENVASIEGY